MTPDEVTQVDQIVSQAMIGTDVPSVSIAIVRRGKLVFAKAYGARSLSPAIPATAADRYRIGSVSKQFTATAILLLADRGQLSLDDKVGRYLPGLAGETEITLRQALSHTAGYSSYFMGDFTPPEGRRRIDPREIARRWGKAPLDFPPGSQWRYSNTGYTLAGLVVEQQAKEPLSEFLTSQVFKPLAMTTAGDADRQPLTRADARGYTRYVIAAPRPAQAYGVGWAFAAGGLAMSASDLARWDIGMLDHRLLSPAGYVAQQTAVPLSNGDSSGYGLGLYVDVANGHRRLRHDGLDDGFSAENRIYPDDHAALVVLINADYSGLQGSLADRLETWLFPAPAPAPALVPSSDAKPLGETAAPQTPPGADDTAALALARQMTTQLRAGALNRALLTADANAYFSPEAVADYGESLSRLGEPSSFVQLRHDVIGGLNASLYELTWPDRKMIAVLRQQSDGKIASFVIFRP